MLPCVLPLCLFCFEWIPGLVLNIDPTVSQSEMLFWSVRGGRSCMTSVSLLVQGKLVSCATKRNKDTDKLVAATPRNTCATHQTLRDLLAARGPAGCAQADQCGFSHFLIDRQRPVALSRMRPAPFGFSTSHCCSAFDESHAAIVSCVTLENTLLLFAVACTQPFRKIDHV